MAASDAVNGTSKKPITFGVSDKWLYDPTSKTYDLSRGSFKTLNIRTADESEPDPATSQQLISLDPEKTALVIVDMQNYFLHPKCRDHPLGLAAVEPTLAALEKCRREAVQVVWLNWGLTDDDLQTMPPSVQRGFSKDLISGAQTGHAGLGADLGDGQGRCLVAGSWNADVYAPLRAAMADGDAQCAKNRMSGLWNPEQPLSRYLKVNDVKTCLFAGVNTDQCVLGTLTDAYSWGWDCILLGDCAATSTGRGAEAVCSYNIANNYGFVIDSKSFAHATRS
ncbi:MAG: hypothetical protein M1837_007286 [Sclerophora amabilis]|nr:MAG: hypothetical protein M1837_007286 [Sclerophora amabilis]